MALRASEDEAQKVTEEAGAIGRASDVQERLSEKLLCAERCRTMAFEYRPGRTNGGLGGI